MKTIHLLVVSILVTILPLSSTFAQEEISFPSNAPLRSLFVSMKRQCLSGKLSPVQAETDSARQFVYKQTVPARKAGIKLPGTMSITMGIIRKKITSLEVTTTSKAHVAYFKEQSAKAYPYHKAVGEGIVYLDNSIANIKSPQQTTTFDIPHGTGAIITPVSDTKYTLRFAPVFQCLRFAAGILPGQPDNYVINYPATLPFGSNLAKLNEERGKYVEMSPNTYQLPLKELFDGKRAGIYMEALALEVGENMTTRQIGVERLIQPEEAGVLSRDIICFSVLTDYNHQLTGMKTSFRFRATYNEIVKSLGSQAVKPEMIETGESQLSFYYFKDKNLCLVLFAAEPYETRGTRGVYNIQALNYSLGKTLYELVSFHKSHYINQ